MIDWKEIEIIIEAIVALLHKEDWNKEKVFINRNAKLIFNYLINNELKKATRKILNLIFRIIVLNFCTKNFLLKICTKIFVLKILLFNFLTLNLIFFVLFFDIVLK